MPELYIFKYAFFLFLFEFIEIYSQRGNSILGMLLHNVVLMNKNILLYVFIHFNFFYIFYLYYVFNNDIILALLFMKFIDIGYKIFLITKISNNQLIMQKTMLDYFLRDIKYTKYINAIIYPIAFVSLF